MNENRNYKDWIKHLSNLGVILLVAGSVFLFISAIIVMFLTKSEKEVVVPGVTGKPFVEAYNVIIRKGLVPEIKFYDVYDIDNGLILSQYPEQGSVVSESDKLKLTVSRNKVYISVPELKGFKLPFALNKLNNLHAGNRKYSLKPGVISYIPSSTVKDNVVIAQSPAASEMAPPDRKINLLVSAGNTEYDNKMPEITGQSVDLCFDLLASRGMEVQQDIELTDKKWKSGIILTQNPFAGEIVSQGKTVKIKVAYYPVNEHQYHSYERVTYIIPDNKKSGKYEVYVEDDNSRRIRFIRQMKPGWKIDFVYKRAGNAKLSIVMNNEVQDVLNVEADDFE